jgi:RNA polymerase sigma factor, sigma-70 family
MNYWSDEVILLELKTGRDTPKSFEQLFMKYFRLLINRAYEMIKDEHVCQDIVQTVFVEFYEHRLYETIQTSIKGYLLTQCRSRCLDYIKKKERYNERLETYSAFTYKLERPHFAVSFQIRDRLDNELNALPPQQQQAFELIFNQGKKYKEAAQHMHTSIDTCKNHYKRAIKRLRSGLADLL